MTSAPAIRRPCLFLTACIFLSMTQLQADETSADVPQPGLIRQLIAHRGASAERPECTAAAIIRAIETGATAVEVDVRTSADGQLFILHDATLDRTTNGTGAASELTLAELQALDAGSWFDPNYANQRIPSLIEAAELCSGRIDLLLDLKEQGEAYDRKVAEIIQQHGDPARTIVGVRSVAQAHAFRRLLPAARQLGLIPALDQIEAFAAAGTETIRIWPRWLDDESEPVRRVRTAGCQLHLNGTLGLPDETLSLLQHQPDSLSSDHPARLRHTLQCIASQELPGQRLQQLVDVADGTTLQISSGFLRERSFLNRDYQMLQLPPGVSGLPRYIFAGGAGNQVRIRFRSPAVVLAVFDYNSTGLWSFPDEFSPAQAGWHLLQQQACLGSSNPGNEQHPHLADIWYREFAAQQELLQLPQWWLCLGIVTPEQARAIEGFQPGLISRNPVSLPQYSWSTVAAQEHLRLPEFRSATDFRDWQATQRNRFRERFLYPHDGVVELHAHEPIQRDFGTQQQIDVTLNGRRIFRYFRLQPRNRKEPGPAVVCFMGHGRVTQLLGEDDSYQHACARRFAELGYLVFAMENVGMSPKSDTHLDLDQSLRLEGYGWYSLLFAHQDILLQQVFRDELVNSQQVGVAGVSTGGLLALSAAVLEPRIAAASIQGIFGSMRVSFIADRHRHCSCGAIAGLLPEFDLPHLALLTGSCQLQICNGSDDGFPPQEAERCLRMIEPLLESVGAPTPELRMPTGRHEFQFEVAAEFLNTTLRFQPDGSH